MPAIAATTPTSCSGCGCSPRASPHSTGTTAAPARMGETTPILVVVMARKYVKALMAEHMPPTNKTSARPADGAGGDSTAIITSEPSAASRGT